MTTRITSINPDDLTPEGVPPVVHLYVLLDRSGSMESIADDVIGFAHKNNVTQIVIGKSTRSRWFEILHGSVVHDLVRRAGNIGIYVIPGEQYLTLFPTLSHYWLRRSPSASACFCGLCSASRMSISCF